jgi:GNAT superfamily N-acetyltransferase
MDELEPPAVRRAQPEDAGVVAQMLIDFNNEFGEPAPPLAQLERRVVELIAGGETVVLLIGAQPEGLAVLRFRPAIWSSGLECYLAELYVRPERRGEGLGTALMQAVLQEARDRGADTMEIGVDEPDVVARRLYERFGFSNRIGGGDGPVMFVYERDLGQS